VTKVKTGIFGRVLLAGGVLLATLGGAAAAETDTGKGTVLASAMLAPKFVVHAADEERWAKEDRIATGAPRRLTALTGNDSVAWNDARSLRQIAWHKKPPARP
jgi:hypothetical protein